MSIEAGWLGSEAEGLFPQILREAGPFYSKKSVCSWRKKMRIRFREFDHNGAGIPQRTKKKRESGEMKEKYGWNEMDKSDPRVRV